MCYNDIDTSLTVQRLTNTPTIPGANIANIPLECQANKPTCEAQSVWSGATSDIIDITKGDVSPFRVSKEDLSTPLLTPLTKPKVLSGCKV